MLQPLYGGNDRMLDNIPNIQTVLGAVLSAPLLTFFNVPAFYLLLTILGIDFLTGMYKSRILKNIVSSRFSDAFERMFNYTIIYIALHIIVIICAIFSPVEQVILAGLAMREAISIVENIKTIELFRGRKNKVLDKLVDLLGLNLDKLLNEAGDPVKPTIEEKKDDNT